MAARETTDRRARLRLLAMVVPVFLALALPAPLLGAGGSGGARGGGGHPAHGGRYHGPVVSWGWGWGWGPSWAWWGWGSPWGWGPGYANVVVVDGRRPAPSRYAAVKTDVTPEAAELFLDGKYIGIADDFDGFPDLLYLGPGTYSLELRHPLYRSLSRTLDLRAGQQVTLDDEMTLLPGKGKLDSFDPPYRGMPLGRVFSKGTGGELRGVEERKERTAVEVERIPPAPPGEKAAPAPDGKAAPEPKEPPAARSAPARGRITFSVLPRDAVVYLDDRYLGSVDELQASRRGLPVPPGKHSVTVVRPGYKAQTLEVQVVPGETLPVEVELER